MKTKSFLSIGIVTLILAACSSSSETIASTKTTFPTTPAKPTETETLSPTPTDTLVPTGTPTPISEIEGGKQLRIGAYETLLNIGDSFLEDEYYLAAEEVYSEMLNYELEPIKRAEVLSHRGYFYDAIGDFDAAIEDYTASVELDPFNVLSLYSLCWDYAVANQAELGLPYCEEVVLQSPKPYYMDGRGITYALLGRYEEAIADFEVVVTDLEGKDFDSALAMRLDWITVLEAGGNPFSPEALAELQTEYTRMVEEMPIYIPEEVDLSREALKSRFENYDFIFKALETIDSEEVLIGSYQEGECKEGVSINGPEDEVSFVSLAVNGCKDDFTQGEFSWFMSLFFTESDYMVDSPCLGKVFAWTITDIYYVIQGIQTDPVSIEIEGVVFTVEPIPELYSLQITAEIND
jgi:hypothetical protein